MGVPYMGVGWPAMNIVVVSIIFVIFTPIPGEMIQFDEHIFQMGWFNHQLVISPKEMHCFCWYGCNIPETLQVWWWSCELCIYS